MNVSLRQPFGTPGRPGDQDRGLYTGNYDFSNGNYVLQYQPPFCSQAGQAPCIPGSSLPPHVVVSPNGKILHNSLDSDPSPGHITWSYTKPSEGASGITPILELKYTMPFPGSSQQPPLKMSSIITLDGRTLSNSGAGGMTTPQSFPSAPGSGQ